MPWKGPLMPPIYLIFLFHTNNMCKSNAFIKPLNFKRATLWIKRLLGLHIVYISLCDLFLAFDPLYLPKAPSNAWSTSRFVIYAKKWSRKTMSHKFPLLVTMLPLHPLVYKALHFDIFGHQAMESWNFRFWDLEPYTPEWNIKWGNVIQQTAYGFKHPLSPLPSFFTYEWKRWWFK